MTDHTENGGKILDSLPHRHPFLFLDEVVEISPGRSVTCSKTFSAGDPLFEGHFPGDPIVPGVLLTEALAQAAGLVAASDSPEPGFLLSSIQKMKFPSAARPGETIELFVEKSGELEDLLVFDGTAMTGKRVVAEGRLVLNRRTYGSTAL